MTIWASRAVAAGVAAAIAAGGAAKIVAAVSSAWEMAARTNLARETAAADDPPAAPSETCAGHPALPNKKEAVTTAADVAPVPGVSAVPGAAAAPNPGAAAIVAGAAAIVAGAAAMTVAAVFAALEMAARTNLARETAAADDSHVVQSETQAGHPALPNEMEASTMADVVVVAAAAPDDAAADEYSND